MRGRGPFVKKIGPIRRSLTRITSRLKYCKLVMLENTDGAIGILVQTSPAMCSSQITYRHEDFNIEQLGATRSSIAVYDAFVTYSVFNDWY